MLRGTTPAVANLSCLRMCRKRLFGLQRRLIVTDRYGQSAIMGPNAHHDRTWLVPHTSPVLHALQVK